MQNIVSIQWLLARMYEPEQTIVDCRFTLGQPQLGREAYEQEHIPGAIYLDLEQDLSAPVSEHGGRHPLPEPETFAAKLAKLGISNNTRVVVYDDEGGMNAARLWWMLRWLGHENVTVLDGGFTAWKKAGYPVSDAQAVRVPTSFTPNVQHHLRTDVNEVREIVTTLRTETNVEGIEVPVLIDSRAHDRYLGQNETMDRIGGHIPGAINFFWKDVLNEDGSYKSPDELLKHFEGIDKDDKIVVYCGSGVSACPNVLALTHAGFANVRLYSGSWSDWISYEENPVATGEEV